MSTKLKINIVLLCVMTVSTMYFLHQIDVQERILTQYVEQQNEIKSLEYYKGKPFNITTEARLANGGKLDTDISRQAYLDAKPNIFAYYRYVAAIDIIALIAILVLHKSLTNQSKI